MPIAWDDFSVESLPASALNDTDFSVDEDATKKNLERILAAGQQATSQVTGATMGALTSPAAGIASQEGQQQAMAQRAQDVASGIGIGPEMAGQAYGALTSPAAGEASAEGRLQSSLPRRAMQAAFESAALPPGAAEGQQRLAGGYGYGESLLPIPSLPIREGEPGYLTVAKEAANVALGIPKFLTSPLGLTVAPAGAFAPTITAAGFTADMANELRKQAAEAGKDWDTMTPTQKRKSVVDLFGTAGLAAFTGLHTAKGTSKALGNLAEIPEVPIPGEPMPIPPISEATTVTPITEKGAPNARSIEEATAVHGDLFTQPVEGTKEMPASQGGGGVQPQATGGLPETQEGAVLLTDPNTLVPALKPPEGPVVIGERGNIHDDIYKAAKAKNEVAGLMLQTSEPEHGFWDGKEFLTRKQAAERLGEPGELHAQRLNELQSEWNAKRKIPKQIPTPETFNTIDDLLKFRETRRNEEIQLYKDQIGLTDEEADHLQDLLSRNKGTSKFEKSISPEKQKKLNDFFNGPLNQKDSPFQFWQFDARYNPEELKGETDPQYLASALFSALSDRVEPSATSDKFIYSAVAAKTLKDLGVTQRQLSNLLADYSKRVGGGEGYFRIIAERLRDFLKSQNLTFEETPREKQIAQTQAQTPAAATDAEQPVVEGVRERGRATTADILDDIANQARNRIKSRGQGLKFNVGPLGEIPNIQDYAIIGAAKIARGALDFGKWSGEMIKEFGEKIAPHLEAIFTRSQATFGEHTSVVERVNRILSEAELASKAVTTAGKKAVGKAIEAGAKAGKALTQAEVAPKLADLQTQLSDSIPKAQALREYFRGQQKGGAEGRKAATKELALADKWLEADANRIRESLVKFANASLPVSERGRFLKAIADATKRPALVGGDPEMMYRKAATVAARIEDRAVEVRKAGLVTEIKDSVAKSLASPSVDIGYKKQILDAIKRIATSKPSQATINSLKATRDYLARQEAAGKDVELPKEVLDELEVLGKTPAKELPEHVLEAIRDKIQLLDKLGRLKVKTRKQVWEIQKNQRVRELAKEPTNPISARPEFRPQPGDPTPLSMRIRNWMNRQLNGASLVDKALLPIDALFDLLGDAKGTYRGWLFRNVRNPIDLDFNAANALRDTLTQPVEAIIKKNNLGQREAERIGVFAQAMQEGGVDRMVSMGVKPETIDNILKTITPAEMKAYRAMREAMDSMLPEVQKLMHELYNIDVKPVENYFPMPRDWSVFEPEPKEMAQPGYGKEMDFDELSGWKQMLGDFRSPQTTRAERGFTIKRQEGAETPIKLNAFDVFQQHMQDVTYLLKTQRDLKMMGEIARGDLFKEKYGDVGRNLILGWLDTVARQGKLGGFRRIPILDELRRRTSAGVIGFRLASQFVHLSNVPLAMWRTGGPLWWKAGLGESLTERGQKFLKENFSETLSRSGSEPALEEAAEKGISAFGKTVVPKAVTKASFAIARGIDRYNAQATTLGIYLRLLAQKGLDATKYDSLPIDKQAQAQALVLARRAVASPLPKDVSGSLARGAITGGNISVGRSLFQFQNIFQDQWSNIRHDLARAGIREKNPKLAATAFIALTATLMSEMGIREAAKQTIANITGHKQKKEESPESRIVKEAVRRIPFGGQLATMFLYGETGIPMFDSMVDVAKAAHQVAVAKRNITKQKALIRAAAGAAQLGGIPGASQIGELLEKAQ